MGTLETNPYRYRGEKWTISQKKVDEMLEKFLQVTSTVGSQIQGMNSSIVKLKEEGDDRYKQFNERTRT